MNRRDFLKAALASSFAFPLLEQHAWAFSNGKDDPSGQKLIVVMLRGGVDGLNVVAPYGDNRYKQIRPTIAMSRGTGLIDLDGYWGIHPALAPLAPLFKERTMGFVHSCGSPDHTRSHFDAQDYMESGVPGRKSVSTGWLNRLVTQLPSKNSPIQAISLGPVLPRICAGPATVSTIGKQGAKNKGLQRMQRRRKMMANDGDGPVPKVFADMYGGRNDELGQAFELGSTARTKVNDIMESSQSSGSKYGAMEQRGSSGDDAMTREQIAANRGALTPKSSPEFGKQLATLFTKDPTIQVAFVDFGGWDTHVREGAEKGQLADHLSPLASGLSDLVRDLGPMYKNTTIVVMSEFGRTAAENGNGGTDHGHGNAMWLLGGHIPGGKVYGRWGGLADSALNEGRDLPTSTDFRAVLSKVLGDQLGLSSKQLAAVFPDFQLSGNPFVQV